MSHFYLNFQQIRRATIRDREKFRLLLVESRKNLHYEFARLILTYKNTDKLPENWFENQNWKNNPPILHEKSKIDTPFQRTLKIGKFSSCHRKVQQTFSNHTKKSHEKIWNIANHVFQTDQNRLLTTQKFVQFQKTAVLMIKLNTP